MENSFKSRLARCTAGKLMAALCVAAVGVALAATGIYVGESDDAPGAAVIGFVLLIIAIVFAVKIALREPPPIPRNI